MVQFKAKRGIGKKRRGCEEFTLMCSLAFHNILMLTSELTPDTSKETICKLILHFFLFFPFDDVCNFVVEGEALRQALEEKLHSMSPARKAAFFKKFIPHPIFEYIKDEFLS